MIAQATPLALAPSVSGSGVPWRSPANSLKPPAGQPNFSQQTLSKADAKLALLKLAYDDLQNRRKALPSDVLLDYTALDKGLHHLKNTFVTLPKTVLRGLKGADDFTFSEMMQVARVPYYLGGLFLTLSPFIGGNKFEGIRQGVAVALYMGGSALANTAINTLYRLRYGVDLTMMYRSKSGQTEYVFASNDFPRFDLLTPKHYSKLAKSLGVPPGVYEPDGAVREELRNLIASSRTLKLVVGNVAAAIAAGYLARTDAWLNIPRAFKTVGNLWKEGPVGQHLGSKLLNSSRVLLGALRSPTVERLAVSSKPLWQKAVVWGAGWGAIATFGYIMLNSLVRKTYTTGVSPSLWANSPFNRFSQQTNSPPQVSTEGARL